MLFCFPFVVESLRDAVDKKQRVSQSDMMTSLTLSTKDRGEVEEACRVVYGFLKRPDEPLRRFVLAASDGGVHFVSSVWARTGQAAVAHRKELADSETAGITLPAFTQAAQARLCE